MLQVYTNGSEFLSVFMDTITQDIQRLAPHTKLKIFFSKQLVRKRKDRFMQHDFN